MIENCRFVLLVLVALASWGGAHVPNIRCLNSARVEGMGYDRTATCDAAVRQCVKLEVDATYLGVNGTQKNGTAMVANCAKDASLCNSSCTQVYEAYRNLIIGQLEVGSPFTNLTVRNCRSTCCGWSMCNNNTVETIRSLPNDTTSPYDYPHGPQSTTPTPAPKTGTTSGSVMILAHHACFFLLGAFAVHVFLLFNL